MEVVGMSNILILDILYAFRIFQMSMKSQWWNHIHLEYSILISYIQDVYGQANLYEISKMCMNTPNAKKGKNLKNKKNWLEKFEKKKRADSIWVWNWAYLHGIHTHIVSSMNMQHYAIRTTRDDKWGIQEWKEGGQNKREEARVWDRGERGMERGM